MKPEGNWQAFGLLVRIVLVFVLLTPLYVVLYSLTSVGKSHAWAIFVGIYSAVAVVLGIVLLVLCLRDALKGRLPPMFKPTEGVWDSAREVKGLFVMLSMGLTGFLFLFGALPLRPLVSEAKRSLDMADATVTPFYYRFALVVQGVGFALVGLFLAFLVLHRIHRRLSRLPGN